VHATVGKALSRTRRDRRRAGRAEAPRILHHVAVPIGSAANAMDFVPSNQRAGQWRKVDVGRPAQPKRSAVKNKIRRGPFFAICNVFPLRTQVELAAWHQSEGTRSTSCTAPTGESRRQSRARRRNRIAGCDRPVRTRTADLYRVNAEITSTYNNLQGCWGLPST
jgi:hypothetical protein